MSEGNLTWVKGAREELDDTSKKILRGGRVHNGNHTAASGNAMAAAGGFDESHASGTSVFDPVLCELAYRWFTRPGWHILDPFAGGSVRGIVASLTGRQYTGLDLSARQLAANREQAEQILSGATIIGTEEPAPVPQWIEGDAKEIGTVVPGQYDLIFSCPPYGDLERYSDDPRDFSTRPYQEFRELMRSAIAQAVMMLRPNRFAAFVVGDFRDTKGFYRNFISHTIEQFESAGAFLYNEAILVTAVGSLPIRIGRQFGRYRKLGKTHQQMLVFYKGDPQRIPEELGKCDFGDATESENPLAKYGEPL